MSLPDPVVLVAALIVGMSKGGMSTLGSIAVPLMALRMDPLSAAALLLPVYIASDVVGVLLYRNDRSLRNVAILIPAGLLGVALATVVAPYVSADVFLVATGVIGLAYCARAWLGRGRQAAPRAADVPRGMFWGMMTGLVSFISHSGGPPYQVYVLPQKLPKIVYAGTTTIVFAAINLAKLPAYWSIGLFERTDLMAVWPLLAAALAGTVLGYRLTLVLPERIYMAIIQILLFLLSVRLVWDGVAALYAGAV